MAKKEARRGKNRQSHQHQLNGHSRRKPARRHKDRGNANKTSRAAAIKSELEQVLGVQAIEQVPIGRLQPNPRNVRCHSDRQIEQLVASVQATRHMNPLVVDEAYRVLAGHARLEVAKRTGLGKVPCIRIEHLTEAGKRALALADNRLAELSEWDEALLTAELEELSALDLEFDWEVTGFDTVDLDRLLMPEPNPQMRNGDSHGLSTDPDDDVPSLLGTTPITRHCDIWQCGEHRIGCGDSVDQDGDIYSRVLAGERATQCVSDPPYNVRIFGHVTGMAGFREFSMASGEMSDSQFVGFLTRFLLNAARHCRDGAIFHTFMDWRHLEHLFQAARKAGLALLNLCAWCKPQAGMGSFYRSQHELVAVLKAGQTAHINTFGLGARGRSRSNVWHYPAVRGPRRGVNAPGQGGHPTAKPVSLLIDAIREAASRAQRHSDELRSFQPSLENMRAMTLKTIFRSELVTDDLVEARFQMSTGRHQEAAVLRRTAKSPAPVIGRLGEITSPTLIFWGADDHGVALERSLLLMQALPNAELHVFRKCAHWVQWDQAARFNQMVAEFLA